MASVSSSDQSRRAAWLALLVSLRPRQWTKNLLLFAGLLFTLDQKHAGADFGRAALGFVLFSLLSSVVYLINDLLDRDSDRRHPKKCRRPIASGELSPRAAGTAAFVLGAVSLVLSFRLSLPFGLVALIYFGLTAWYSLLLKHVVIVDVMTVAAGFVLRAIAGAVVIGVLISPWLIQCTAMLALFLALSKRRAELTAMQQGEIVGTRRILDEYSPALLDQMIVIVTSASLMSYALYTIESEAASRHHLLMLTIPFVVYGIFRYLYLIHNRALGESPDALLLEDKPLLLAVLLWGLTTGLIVTHALNPLLVFFQRGP